MFPTLCITLTSLHIFDSFRSINPIAHKAMDKTVEKIEQHYMTQKRGIEGKIMEIETELHSSLER